MSRARFLELTLILAVALSVLTSLSFLMRHDALDKDFDSFLNLKASFSSMSRGRRHHGNRRGIVHYETSHASGFNNQRQAAMMAWVLAYLNGYTLEWKDYRPAYTGVASDSNRYDHGTFWDLQHLQKYVEIRNVSSNHRGEYDYQMNLSTRFQSMSQVQDLGAHYTNLSYNAPWSFMPLAFPWLRPSLDNQEQRSKIDPNQGNGHDVFRKLIESFSFTKRIQDLAQQVIQQLVAKSLGSQVGTGPRFIGMHQRQHRQPAINCRRLGTTYLDMPQTMKHDIRKYSKGACQGIDWSNVISTVFSSDKTAASLPIYIAHDSSFPSHRGDFRTDYRSHLRYLRRKYGPKNPEYLEAVKKGANSSQTIPGFPPGSMDASDFKDTVFKGVPPAVVAAVEQEILIHSTYFISSLHSSFSEFVIFKRAIQTPPPPDAQQNFDVWMEKLLLLESVPRELLPPDHGVAVDGP